MKGPFEEEIQFFDMWSEVSWPEEAVFFVDEILKDKINLDGLHMLKHSGESLKTLKDLKTNLQFLQKHSVRRDQTLVSVGGGSLGDSVGFLSSVYLRGLPFVQVPTTWLSAIDASVGGKTALNFEGFKNQIGTFYPPQRIVFVKELIESSSLEAAKGEVFKTLFLNLNESWSRDLLKQKGRLSFSDLKHFIEYKTDMVKKDPYETSGLRMHLNLGHTLAHALELNLNLSHSEAVMYGLRFCVNWSRQSNKLSKERFELIDDTLPPLKKLLDENSSLSSDSLYKALLKDKKRREDKISFVFLKDEGACVEPVKTNDIVSEYERQTHI